MQIQASPGQNPDSRVCTESGHQSRSSWETCSGPSGPPHWPAPAPSLAWATAEACCLLSPMTSFVSVGQYWHHLQGALRDHTRKSVSAWVQCLSQSHDLHMLASMVTKHVLIFLSLRSCCMNSSEVYYFFFFSNERCRLTASLPNTSAGLACGPGTR